MFSPKMTNDMKNLSFSQIETDGLYLDLPLLYSNFLITTIGDLAPNITTIFDHKLSAKVSTDNDIMIIWFLSLK
ncbi:MAG: hypothetical protein F6K24_35320 [Okeania sp. SIO2D1]|nr:hypothetical protein [Okeania sp. SIO2D1]